MAEKELIIIAFVVYSLIWALVCLWIFRRSLDKCDNCETLQEYAKSELARMQADWAEQTGVEPGATKKQEWWERIPKHHQSP